MTTSDLRQKIVAEARSWLDTPYHHAADVKGVGVDCAMLLLRVYVDLGLAEPFDPRPYPHDWHLHRDEERYADALLSRAHRVEAPLPGDAVIFRVGRCYSHGAIVTRAEPLTIVHAVLQYGRVVEEEIATSVDLTERLKTAIIASVVEDAH
jgi:cell wall-associated NlpC family hydrolase